jgi:hypothetical protein
VEENRKALYSTYYVISPSFKINAKKQGTLDVKVIHLNTRKNVKSTYERMIAVHNSQKNNGTKLRSIIVMD